MISVPVYFRRGVPTIRAILRGAGLVQGHDWTWHHEPTRTPPWSLVTDEKKRTAICGLLEPHYPDVASVLQEVPDDGSSLTTARYVLATSLLDRVRPLIAGADLSAPRVLTALLSTAYEATSYMDDTGAWDIEETPKGEVVRVKVRAEGPAWASGVPGVWYDSSWAICDVSRVPAVISAVASRAPSIAASMTRAFFVASPGLPEDTDYLSRAHLLEQLPPDLRLTVETIMRKVPLPHGLSAREYQQIAAVFALATGNRALIADAPGVGKSLAAILTLKIDVRRMTPAVVVAPASVLTSWYDEIKRWAPGLFPVVVDGDTVFRPLAGRVWIVSWSRLAALADELLRAGVQTVILDEAHYGKHHASVRSQAAAALCKAAPHVLALTGTPLENRTADLWHLLHLLKPQDYADRKAFVDRYGTTKRRTIGGRTLIDDRRDTLLPELRDVLRGVMVRRLKTDVLTDLPEKTRINVWLDLPRESRRAYDEAEAGIAAIVADSVRQKRTSYAIRLLENGASMLNAVAQANALNLKSPAEVAALAIVVLGYMRRMVGRAKVPLAVSWLEDWKATGEPLLVFCEHLAVRDEIGAALDKMKLRWDTIDGSVDVQERGARVRAFQAGEIDVFLLMTKAANTGITLHHASNVLFAERDFVPSAEEQAEDRANRLGQKNAVTAYYLMANDTVDVRLAELADQKRALAAAVIGSERVGEREGEDVQADDRKTARSAAAIFAARVEAALSSGTDGAITDKDVRKALARGRKAVA